MTAAVLYQGKSRDSKQHFKAAVDEEGAEQSQAVISKVFERQLEDVSPANTAQVDFLRRAVGGSTERKELWATAKRHRLVLND